MEMRRRAIRSLCVLIKEQVGNDPVLGVEVGVWRGDTSAWLLKAFPNLQLYCVDPWETGGGHTTLEASVRELREAKQQFLDKTQFAHDRRIVLAYPSIKAVEWTAPSAFDFVFIDAEHTYEEVYKDLRAWAPKVRNMGLLCGHDYNAPYDRKKIFGVKRAVDEYAAENNRTVRVNDWDIWWFEPKDIPWELKSTP